MRKLLLANLGALYDNWECTVAHYVLNTGHKESQTVAGWKEFCRVPGYVQANSVRKE